MNAVAFTALELIFMDVTIPSTSDVAISLLRARNIQIPIVVTGGYCFPDLVDQLT